MPTFFKVKTSKGDDSGYYSTSAIESIVIDGEAAEFFSLITLSSGRSLNIAESPKIIIEKFKNPNSNEIIELTEFNFDTDYEDPKFGWDEEE